MNGVVSVFLTLTLLGFAESEGVCDEQRYAKKQFVITSKNYPDPYPENLNCSFFIEGDGCPRKYNFQFLDFDLEREPECLKDYLDVGGQERLCGAKSGVKSFFAPQGSLFLRFVTDQAIAGRGFKLLITKLPCEDSVGVPQKQNFYNFDWRQIFGGWGYKPASQTTQFCCQQAYSAKHFFLSSPNFPYSDGHPNDCAYHIYKASQNVCRLRIHMVYFSHGDFDGTCLKNFLEIDGRKVCGCQTDLKLIVPFDYFSSTSPKVLRFKSDGSHRSEHSGFALEIFQDECPRKCSPESAKLIFENQENVPQSQIVKHVYFFSDPEESSYDDHFPKDREETTYMDTSDAGFRLSGSGAAQCEMFDFAQLAQNELWVQTSQCKGRDFGGANCKELSAVKGLLFSPGYPYYYPRNLNLCFRFKKQPGYCAVRLAMADFQIESSMDCNKDYLLLGGKFRYCGQQLHNTISTLDLTKTNFEDVIFKTDSYYCGRGFKAVYEQIPCMHDHTTPPPVVTQTPPVPCNSLIDEPDYVLNIYASQQDTCVFTISRSDSNVCRVELRNLLSNLDCNSEDVFVRGRSLCSLTESDSFSVDFKEDDGIPVVYKRFIQNPGVNGLRIRLHVKQSSENCFYNVPEVPAEKLTSPLTYGLFLELTDSTGDLCGIIANARFADSAEDSCKNLMELATVKSCVSAKLNQTELPENAEKIQLLLSQESEKQDVFVHKVSCDYL